MEGIGMIEYFILGLAGVAIGWTVRDMAGRGRADDLEDAIARAEILREIGVMPYPMFNRHAKRTQHMTDFKRWCRPWLFFTFDWKDYRRDGHI